MAYYRNKKTERFVTRIFSLSKKIEKLKKLKKLKD
jgi:hypothetical protein